MVTFALKHADTGRCRDLSLLFASGGFEVVLGLPGAGKTSLLRAVTGLERLRRGSAYCGGVEVTRADARQRDALYVPRGGTCYPHLSVDDNLALPLRARRARDVARRVAEVAAAFDLEADRPTAAAHLSPLRRQLLALARAAVRGARVVALDEPLAVCEACDYTRVRDALRATLLASGSIVLVAVADPQQARHLGGSLTVLDDGRVLQRGPIDEVCRLPGSLRVAELCARPELNVWPLRIGADARGRLDDRLTFPLPDSWRVLPPGEYRVGIAAHRLRLDGPRPGSVEIPAAVRFTETVDLETVVHASHRRLDVIVRRPGLWRLTRRQAVDVFFDPRRAVVFTVAGRTLCGPEAAADGAD